MMLERARDKFDRFIAFPIQLTILVSAIVLVEIGTRAHKLYKRQFNEDLPR